MSHKVLSIGLLLLIAASSGYAETPKAEQTVSALTPLSTAASKPFLDVQLLDGKDRVVRPGDALETELKTSRATYITFVRVDAHGMAEVSQPDLGSTGNLLVPGAAVFYPAEGSAQPFVARLPAGQASMMVLATEKPITGIHGADLRPGGEAVFVSADEAPGVLAQLRNDIASGKDGQFQLASFPYSVKVGSEMQSYSVEQIVDYFAHVTRNADSPRLEGWGVNFAFNSAEVLPASKAELDKWGRVLSDPLLANQQFVVCGHTDDLGTDEFNYELSLQRANTVRQALIAQYGISPNRLVTKGFGKTQPLVKRQDKEGRAVNRRVEFERATRIGAGSTAR